MKSKWDRETAKTTLEIEYEEKLLIKEALQALKLKAEREIEDIRNRKVESGMEFLEEVFPPECHETAIEILQKKIAKVEELLSFF